MANLNKVMLIGRLGRDPEIRYSQQGMAMVNFSVATSKQWTDKNSGEKQERTEWHNIKVFGRQAETCEKYLSKGSQVYIEGELRTNTYEKEGQTRYFTEVVVNNFQFLGGRQDNQGGSGYQGGGGYQQQPNTGGGNQFQNQTYPGSGGQEPVPDDDIPF